MNWVVVVDLLRFVVVKIRILGCRLKFIELKHVRYKIQNIKQRPGVGYVIGVELDGMYITLKQYVGSMKI